MELHLANLPPEVDVFSEMLGAEIAVLEIDVSNLFYSNYCIYWWKLIKKQ